MTEGEALGHEVASWTIDQEGTCSQPGSQHGTCTRCGEEITEVIRVDHTEGEWTVTTEPEVGDSGEVTPGVRTLTCAVCGAQIRSEEYTPSDEEVQQIYAGSCAWPSYEDVARNPDDWEGARVAFSGEVIQVLQDGNSYTLRVNVTTVSYGYTDTIMVTYTAPTGASRILEDDVITFYGVMRGMHPYTSVLGATITVPLMKAVYIAY